MKRLGRTPLGWDMYVGWRFKFYWDIRLSATYVAFGPFTWVKYHKGPYNKF